MIVEFSIANFRSIKELQTFSMVGAPLKSKYKDLDVNNVIFIDDKLNLLRSKAIYGSNASGKSNIIKAFILFWTILDESIKNEKVIEMYSSEYFSLNNASKDEPLFFQIIFLIEKVQYRYGFTFKNGSILSEWLYGLGTKSEVYYFVREEVQVKVNERRYSEAKKFEKLTKESNNEIFRNNSLFLNSVAVMGGSFSRSVINAIVRNTVIINGVTDNTIFVETVKQMRSETGKAEILELLKSADINIAGLDLIEEEVEISTLPSELKHELNLKNQTTVERVNILSKRFVYNDDGKQVGETSHNFLSFESEGTQKMFHLGALLLRVLKRGKTLIIDEFDARLHPLLTKKIVSLFHSDVTNPNGAQLIFVTHDVNLLKPSFLRRDQICFVEKDKYGASRFKTLIEYKGIRNDASYDKDYLQGLYGAVPFLNDLDTSILKGIENYDSQE